MSSRTRNILWLIMVLGVGFQGIGLTQQTSQTGVPSSSAGPQAKTKEEHEAYIAFYQEADSKKKIEMGNKFLADFSASEFKPNVMLLMIQAFQASRDHKMVVEWGETLLNNFPENASKAFVFQALMMANQALNDLPKTVDYAEKLLAADLNNLSAIYTIPFVLSERSRTSGEEGRKKELTRAAEVASKGLAMAKPAQLSDEQWVQFQTALHSSMGLIHLNNKDYPLAQSEYLKALVVSKDDPVLYFRSGLAFSFDKKYDEAIDLLSRAVYLKGITETQARTELERIYRIKNGITTTGPELQAVLQKLVEEAGAKLKQ